jgi:phage terminase large subunit
MYRNHQNTKQQEARTLELNISEELFVPVYRPLIVDDKLRNIPRKILYGSRDSAKSHFVGQNLIIDCLEQEYFRCILIRKVYDTIKDSQFQKLIDIITDWKLDEVFVGNKPLFSWTTRPLEIRCFNGNKFIAKGLDKPSKLKSLSDPTCAWYEEIEEISENDYDKITFSLRSSKTDLIKEYLVFNPPDEGGEFWVIKRFFPENFKKYEQLDGLHTFLPAKPLHQDDTLILHTCYKHNPYVKNARKSKFEKLAASKPDKYKVEGLGLIRKRLIGKRFYSFSRKYHVGTIEECAYNPNKDLHITYDFNVMPYQTLLVSQLYKVKENHYKLVVVAQILGRYPDNKPNRVTQLFAKKYKGKHKARVFIYGDPSGNAEDKQYFKVIRNVLSTPGYLKHELNATGRKHEIHNFKVEVRAGRSIYFVVQRAMFINSLLEGDTSGGLTLDLVVHPECVDVIEDYEQVKEDTDGTKLKNKVTDEETKRKYEEHGHCTDAMDYLICRMFINYYDRFRKTI